MRTLGFLACVLSGSSRQLRSALPTSRVCGPAAGWLALALDDGYEAEANEGSDESDEQVRH